MYSFITNYEIEKYFQTFAYFSFIYPFVVVFLLLVCYSLYFE